jgi:hypothetical protein
MKYETVDNDNCFAFEDTTETCYRDVVQELIKRGWKRITYKKRSKLAKKR